MKKLVGDCPGRWSGHNEKERKYNDGTLKDQKISWLNIVVKLRIIKVVRKSWMQVAGKRNIMRMTGMILPQQLGSPRVAQGSWSLLVFIQDHSCSCISLIPLSTFINWCHNQLMATLHHQCYTFHIAGINPVFTFLHQFPISSCTVWNRRCWSSCSYLTFNIFHIVPLIDKRIVYVPRYLNRKLIE